MAVDHLERGEQPLARLAVEALDALAQPLDRLDQVVALGHQGGVLRLDLAQLFLGAQIDRAEPLAVAPQFFQIRPRPRSTSGRASPGLMPARPASSRRLDFQHFLDLVSDVAEPALGAGEPLLGARRVLARRAHRLERRAGGAIGLGERVLGDGQTVGRGAARGFGRLDLA